MAIPEDYGSDLLLGLHMDQLALFAEVSHAHIQGPLCVQKGVSRGDV